MPNVQISDSLPLETITGSEIVHTKDSGGVDSTMTADQIGSAATPVIDFDPSSSAVIIEEDALVMLQSNEGTNMSLPQMRTLLGGTDYLGDNQDWIDTFTAGGGQDDVNFFRALKDILDNQSYIQGEHDLGGLQFRFGRFLRADFKAEKVNFRNPFPNKCVTCHIVAHRDVHDDDIQVPMNVSTFEKDHFWMNRTTFRPGLTFVTTSWLAIGF